MQDFITFVRQERPEFRSNTLWATVQKTPEERGRNRVLMAVVTELDRSLTDYVSEVCYRAGKIWIRKNTESPDDAIWLGTCEKGRNLEFVRNEEGLQAAAVLIKAEIRAAVKTPNM